MVPVWVRDDKFIREEVWLQDDCASKVGDARKDLSEELPTLGDVAKGITFEGKLEEGISNSPVRCCFSKIQGRTAHCVLHLNRLALWNRIWVRRSGCNWLRTDPCPLRAMQTSHVTF